MDHRKMRLVALMGIMLVSMTLIGTVNAETKIEVFFGSVDHCNDTTNYAQISDTLNITSNLALNYVEGGGSPPTENFTNPSWTETIGGARLTQTEDKVTWTNYDRVDELSFSWIDGDGLKPNVSSTVWSMFFELRVTDIENTAGGTVLYYPVSVISGYNFLDWRQVLFGNYEAVGLRIASALSQDEEYYMGIVELENGAQFASASVSGLDVGTSYWINWTRSGTSLTLKMYSDSDYNVQVGSTISHTMQANHAGLNDLYAGLGHDANSGNRDSSGYINALSYTMSAGGGYESEGQVTSVTVSADSNITLPLDSFCIRSERPTGSTVSIQFSDDNSTWIRADGVAGWDEVSADYECVDLTETFTADPNEFYYRIKLTSNGAVTPTVESARILIAGEVADSQSWGLNLLTLITGIIFGASKWMRQSG